MVDPNILVRKNLELEGLLKVLIDRDSIEARSMLAEKFRAYAAMMEEYLAGDVAENAPAAEEAVAAADATLQQGHYIEVKDQEAVEAEDGDSGYTVSASLVSLEPPTPPVESDKQAIEKDTADEKPVTYTPPEPPAQQNDRVLRAFTLNDRFRFCRELFSGNSDDFTDTVNVLSQLPSYADAEDYLYNDLMWNRDDDNVKAFMAILKENMA